MILALTQTALDAVAVVTLVVLFAPLVARVAEAGTFPTLTDYWRWAMQADDEGGNE